MKTRGDTRQRIITAATELFRRQGYTATGMKQIVATAQTPFGSIYHFFPGGKVQMGEEVVRTSGAAYLDLIAALFTDPTDPATATEEAFRGAARTLHDLDYADPCPVATIALETSGTSERLRHATAEVFTSWTDALTAYYTSAGLPAPAANATATSVLALLEGAFMLGRASRSTAPVLATAPAAAAIVRAASAS
ncbi:putative HTH-type transcriptional regulator YxaF [Streptomyces sp. RB5]|uniref:Putative HTH-type transcriptional regulator YxaF n=1 Tax=Streptomyces smaragdinus TaxID=2585196 RepID=A0A7K0CLR9_9ACTN|nr:TetR/AcrR family transcriptional regulator [Streptomyces smaragdinus]MQY13704.1 putative HTH-type transcriptional regulator YxaF [Streptomyces smaragdinus]